MGVFVIVNKLDYNILYTSTTKVIHLNTNLKSVFGSDRRRQSGHHHVSDARFSARFQCYFRGNIAQDVKSHLIEVAPS